jgi:kumamolisin
MNKVNAFAFVSVLSMGVIAGAVASATPMNLVLRLTERVPMEELAKNVMDPASPRYHQFYTADEIRELAAPTDADYQNLLQALQQKGFIVTHESKSHLFVSVTTENTNVENVFQTQIKMTGNGTHGMTFAGTTKALSIPADLSLVQSISGLDNTRKMHNHLRIAPNETHGTISQAQIKKGYNFDEIYKQGYTGKGIHISIATYDGFHMDDVQGFYKKSKISPAPTVDQVSFNGDATLNEDSAAETELDSEFSGMIAPGAQIHVFASADNSDAGETAMFTAILDDGRANIVNYSWGTCETQLAADHQADMDKVYSRAVAQGVNIMVASGDSGSDGCGDGTKVADWPASQPNAVAVGGTSFATSGNKMDETAWSDGGGGISQLYSLPHYQENFQSPYSKRSMPDVAFNADLNTGEQIWTQYQTGHAHWMTIGGTSMAAPQWSGFMALVGEARAQAGKKPLGFLNPILYAMSASTKAQTLNDVTKGNNGYPAGPGWDAASGWGSMQAQALLTYLVNQK